MDYVIRLVAGGLVVLLFVSIGDLLRPKSFAGIFGAATSVALATLSLTFVEHGSDYLLKAAHDAGGLALLTYSCRVSVAHARTMVLAGDDACGNHGVVGCRIRSETGVHRMTMLIRFKPSALKQTRGYESLWSGGVATV